MHIETLPHIIPAKPKKKAHASNEVTKGVHHQRTMHQRKVIRSQVKLTVQRVVLHYLGWTNAPVNRLTAGGQV